MARKGDGIAVDGAVQPRRKEMSRKRATRPSRK